MVFRVIGKNNTMAPANVFPAGIDKTHVGGVSALPASFAVSIKERFALGDDGFHFLIHPFSSEKFGLPVFISHDL